MKEITRIHIAKVAYDIELNAKKDIEKYIAALERYAGDKELLSDIEIRITELLAERGVTAGGVISTDDVAAVRAQLGEPSDFAPEGEEAMSELNDEPRRVYRDEENAVLGGVLAGFARFFGVDPLWIRIVFIVLLFGSFGTALLVYLILWLIIPPAQTAAEKLRMSGKPVTLASIKSLGEKAEPAVSGTAMAVRRLLRIGTGLALVAGSIAAIAIVVVFVVQMFIGRAYDDLKFSGMPSGEIGWIVAGMALFPLAGLLLSALGMVLANAAFRNVWNKRTTTTVIAIIAAGLITFAGGIGTTIYGQLSMQARANENRQTTSVNLPANFASIKSLRVLADDSGIGVGNTNITINYIASDTSRYELEGPNGVKPEFTIGSDGLSATVKVTKSDGNIWRWGYLGSTELRVYGPALGSIETDVNSPSIHYTADKPGDAITATVKGFGLDLSGTYNTVTLTTEEGGFVTMDQATVNDLIVTNKKGRVEAGVVRSLAVTMPDACPAPTDGESNASVRVQAISRNDFVYNGTTYPAKTIENNCGRVVIGPDDN